MNNRYRYEVVFEDGEFDQTVDCFDSMDGLLDYLAAELSENGPIDLLWEHRLEDLTVQKILITETVEKETKLSDLWQDTLERRKEIQEERKLMQKTERYRHYLELWKEFGT